MTEHKHYELMKQYIADAGETDKPWLRWEYKAPADEEWSVFTRPGPTWLPDYEYRRKPRSFTYTVTIPEPLRRAPERGEKYYFADPSTDNLYSWTSWADDRFDKRLYGRGLCFATREDAIAAAKAMLPIKGEEV